MPVKDVHVMKRQQVDELLDKRDGEEMTRAVEVHTAPREARCVGDSDCRENLTIDYRICKKRFTKRLDAVEDTSSTFACDGYAFLVNCQHIAFGPGDLRRQGEFDVIHLLLTLLNDGQRQTIQFLQINLQERCLLL